MKKQKRGTLLLIFIVIPIVAPEVVHGGFATKAMQAEAHTHIVVRNSRVELERCGGVKGRC